MDPDDVVEPVDAALQALLALAAEQTDCAESRDKLCDFILTCPPLREWPADSQDRLRETCHYVVGLAQQLRRGSGRNESCSSRSTTTHARHC
ncbi:hypothetical protein KIH27_08690 [Mycobacterium sp. M1]|uniref:Uncharacterized protein n=1 Tax=Mycolicibacter acidiphilus TaxID=2835306 RepID=A0ABS5RHA9_9MYCO|nr:hypothetical protein [Mycolicibacter acidiphilus]MBS9533660.1 hypothetical protein [Mycolicibacter acidiphilus]